MNSFFTKLLPLERLFDLSWSSEHKQEQERQGNCDAHLTLLPLFTATQHLPHPPRETRVRVSSTIKPVSPSLSNRSPNPNTRPRASVIPHVEIPPIEPVIPPSMPHGSTPGIPAPPKIGQDPKPTPKPDEPEKPEHPDGPDGPDSSSASPTQTSRSRFSNTQPVYFTGFPAAVIVGNTTVTAGASAVFISGHTVAFWASSVLEVDTITTTLASPNKGVPASATVIAGLTVQPVATASTDVGSGPSSGPGPMFTGASRQSFKLPRTLIYGYGSCVLALLLA